MTQTKKQEPQGDSEDSPEVRSPQAPPPPAPAGADGHSDTAAGDALQSPETQQPETRNENNQTPVTGNQGFFPNFPQQDQGNYSPNPRYTGDPIKVSPFLKITWVALGILLGIFSIPLVLIMFMGQPKSIRNQALKYCVIGFAISFVLSFFLLMVVFNGDVSSLLGATSGQSGSTSAGSGSSGSQNGVF